MSIDSISVCAEVIQEMTPYEKEQLMTELSVLMQNQKARVKVSSETGFPYLWRVLTGKQEKLQTQISLNQVQINQIVSVMLTVLWKEEVDVIEDVNNIRQRLNYCEKLLALHGIYLERLSRELYRLGGARMDTDELKEQIEKTMEQDSKLRNKIGKPVEKASTEKELGTALKNHEDEIRVEGRLAGIAFIIHTTGKKAWVLAAVCLVIAIAAGVAMVIPDPAEPVEAVVTAMGLTGAVSHFIAPTIAAATSAPVLASGISAPMVAISACSIGVAGGGIGALNSLRDYRLIRLDKSQKEIILIKKH